MLRCDVNAGSGKARVPGYAGRVNDGTAAILQHKRNFVAHRIKNPPDVGVENAPVLRFSCLFERTLPFDPGVVKSDVESAEFVDRKINHRLYLPIFCDASSNESGIDSYFFDVPHDLATRFFTAA